jgi:hypothetical protein
MLDRGPSFETRPAPQDEAVRLDAKSDPHGEEARRTVSNHEASGSIEIELDYRERISLELNRQA